MSKHLSLVVFLALGCTPGPDHPVPYLGVSLALAVHVADPPAPAPPSFGVSLDFVPYCQPALFNPGQQIDSEPPSFPSESSAFVAAAPSEHVIFPGSPFADNRACGGVPPPVRFFRPRLGFSDGQNIQPGVWTSPGRHVVYSRAPATYLPFGPDGPAASLPAGYSVLHASCSGGAVQLTVESTDQVLEFHRWAGAGVVPSLEEETRQWLATCQVPAPADDLGTRVGLDAPRQLAFSADGTRLLYFVDLTPGGFDSSLRDIPVAGGAPVELADGSANILWLPANGDVYLVDGSGGAQRGRLAPDGSAHLQPLPLSRALGVSPDGTWLAFQPTPSSLAIWNVAAESMRPVGAGPFMGWAPDSHRLAFGGGPVAGPVTIFDVDTGATTAAGTGYRAQWLPDGRLAVVAATAPGEDVTLVGPDGASGPRFHFASASDEYVPAADRLVQLGHRQWPAVSNWIINGQAGLLVEDPTAPGPHLVIPTDRLVFSSRDPGPGYPRVDGGILAWGRRCLGLYETACVFELHRVALPAGTDTVVATSVEDPALAVSSDGHKIAIGTRNGIFVKDLP